MTHDLSIKKLSFAKRPIPIPADYRPMYKMALIVMILKMCCRGETATLLKLHLFSWTLKSEKNMKRLEDYIASHFQNEFSVWGIEPALNRALLLAVGEDLCEMIDGKKYQLTDKGAKFFDLINAESDLFEREKAFLNYVGKNKITDSRIDSMCNQWSIVYA